MLEREGGRKHERKRINGEKMGKLSRDTTPKHATN